jgi:hypothetical protein
LAKKSISHCESKHHKPWWMMMNVQMVDQGSVFV